MQAYFAILLHVLIPHFSFIENFENLNFITVKVYEKLLTIE